MLAVGETVIPLHHPLPVVVVSIVMERESVSKMTVSPTAKAAAGTAPKTLCTGPTLEAGSKVLAVPADGGIALAKAALGMP